MNTYRLKNVFRNLIVGWVMVTLLLSTVVSVQVSPSQAASTDRANEATPVTASDASVDTGVVEGPGDASALPQGLPGPELVPLNTLIYIEAGRSAAVESAILDAGGYVYLQQDSALFVGVEDLDSDALEPLGARAVYNTEVPESVLAAMEEKDRSAAQVWNVIVREGPINVGAVANPNDESPSLLMKTPPQPLEGEPALLADLPDNDQTSVFMMGSVSVDVVFVESISGTENWTQDEIDRVKVEVASALNWWTVASTKPDTPGGPARPPAFTSWDVHYYSPLEGTTTERNNVKVNTEPITMTTTAGSTTWMLEVAHKFIGSPPPGPGPGNMRTWADNTRDADGNDWGFVLYVVDSSADADHLFADGMSAAAALNGPWATVSSYAGSLGPQNLEALIAKMTGHVFGAGDETFEGCQTDERYGYLYIENANCERGGGIGPSLMRSGTDMVDAYRDYELSVPARAMVGWQDLNANDVYDPIDTLVNNLPELILPQICPDIHYSGIEISNTAYIPAEAMSDPYYYPEDPQWSILVWDPDEETYTYILTYRPTNINWPGYVWGKINDGEWIAGSADNGEWNADTLSYNLILPGMVNLVNPVKTVVMNRFGQEASEVDTTVTIQDALPSSGSWYETTNPDIIEFFYADGTSDFDSWFQVDDPGYSGGASKFAYFAGQEACFSFEGTAVELKYAQDGTYGRGQVYVDGEFHSTIDYSDGTQQQTEFLIANLLPGDHRLSLIAETDNINLDAFKVQAAPDTDDIIDAAVDTDSYGFYENTGTKVLYAGDWNPASINNSARVNPDTGGNNGTSSSVPDDRIYAHFKNADTIGVYRIVGPGRGAVDVYLDGEYWGTMKNYATNQMLTPYYISGLSTVLTHTIEIRLNDSSVQFDFDTFRLLDLAPGAGLDYVVNPGEPPLDVPYNGTYERYGTWSNKGDSYLSTATGDVLDYNFQGSAVAVHRRIYSGDGKIEIYVDGKLMRTVYNSAGSAGGPYLDQPVVVHGLDGNFPHVLQIRTTAVSGTAPNKIYGLTVYNIDPVTAGVYEEYEYTGSIPTNSVFYYDEDWDFNGPGLPGVSDGHFAASAHENAGAYLYFGGVDTLTLYARTNANFGKADIYVNGKLKGTFNQYSSSNMFNVPFTITGLDKLASRNVLEIRVNKDNPSLPTRINIDGIVLYNKAILTPGIYENDDIVSSGGGDVAAMQFSGQWSKVTHAAASGGNYHVLSHPNDNVVFDVRDTGMVILYRSMRDGYGKTEVYVNGQYKTNFQNTHAAGSIAYQQPYVISGLNPDVTNEIQLKTYSSNPQPFDIDYIEVVDQYGVASQNFLVEGLYENDDATATPPTGSAISYVGTGWTNPVTTTNPNPPGNTEHQTSTYGDKAMVVFRGNAITVFYHRNSAAGSFRVFMDGEYMGYINAYASTATFDVPYTLAGLQQGMHTMEILALGGGKTRIDRYRVYEAEACVTCIYNLVEGTPPAINSELILSGNWTISSNGEWLTASEAGASMYFYLTGGDTVFITRQLYSGTTYGDFDMYVDGVFINRSKGNYYAGTQEERVTLSGLDPDTKYWIELRTTSAALVKLKKVQMTGLTHYSIGCNLEGEGPNVYPTGQWVVKPPTPDTTYSGSYLLVSKSQFSYFYFGVDNVNYLTVYRRLHPDYGVGDVYIDGEYWGPMTNYHPTVVKRAPFSIGPLSSGQHTIEIRPVDSRAISIDNIECENVPVANPGYYENDDPILMYSGDWTLKTVPAASGGTTHKTSSSGARASFMFYGTSLTVYRTMTPTSGYTNIFVDGVKYKMHSYSTTGYYQVPHTILLASSGPHAVEIVPVTGIFQLDAVEIGDFPAATFGAYQEDDPHIVANDVYKWTYADHPDNSGGAHMYTDKQFADVFFRFYGQRLTVYMTQGPGWGQAALMLDGELLDVVDLNATERTPFFAYDVTGLPEGHHVFEMRYFSPTGSDPANLDVITVNGAPAPRPGEETPPAEEDLGEEEELPDVPTEGCFEEARSEWLKIGTWVQQQQDGASMDYLMRYNGSDPVTAPDVYTEFQFSADGIGLIYHKGPSGGIANIYVDDMVTPYAVLDMYNVTEEWLAYLDITVDNDPPSVHVLRVVATGTKNSSSLGYNLDFDRLDLPAYDSFYDDNCQYIPD